MPHPYFDTTSFPWHREDADAFYSSLHLAVSKAQQIDLLYRKCAEGLTGLPEGITPNLIWKQALDTLAARQLIRKLCDILLAEHPEIKTEVDAVIAARDAIDDVLLSGDLVFFDRKPLRNELVKLSANGGVARVLLVRGERHSGKTWTRYLIEEQAKSRGEGCTYLAEGMVATVPEVIEVLFTNLKGQVPDQFETTPAYYRRACNKLQEAAETRKQRWWIVADDLGTDPNKPILDPEIRKFFDQMALSMANPSFAIWFRLILIDYPDGKVPTNWKGFWSEDRPSTSDAKVEVISQFLLEWATRHGKQMSEEAAKKTAEELIAKVDDPVADASVPRLERIYDALTVVLGERK